MSKDSKKKPEIAFGVTRTPVGWVVTRYQVEGAKVVARQSSEPDLRALALERLARDISEFWEME